MKLHTAIAILATLLRADADAKPLAKLRSAAETDDANVPRFFPPECTAETAEYHGPRESRDIDCDTCWNNFRPYDCNCSCRGWSEVSGACLKPCEEYEKYSEGYTITNADFCFKPCATTTPQPTPSCIGAGQYCSKGTVTQYCCAGLTGMNGQPCGADRQGAQCNGSATGPVLKGQQQQARLRSIN